MYLQNFEIGKAMESAYWNVRYTIVGQITETIAKRSREIVIVSQTR